MLKLLSEDPANYADAPREGIRRVLEAETGVPHLRSAPLDTSRIASIRMGTTVWRGGARQEHLRGRAAVTEALPSQATHCRHALR